MDLRNAKSILRNILILINEIPCYTAFHMNSTDTETQDLQDIAIKNEELKTSAHSFKNLISFIECEPDSLDCIAQAFNNLLISMEIQMNDSLYSSKRRLELKKFSLRENK